MTLELGWYEFVTFICIAGAYIHGHFNGRREGFHMGVEHGVEGTLTKLASDGYITYKDGNVEAVEKA